MSSATFKKPQGHPPADTRTLRSLRSLLEVGWSYRQIASVIVVSDVTCRRYAERWGMPTVDRSNSRRISHFKMRLIRRLLEQGRSATYIAQQADVSRPTVTRYAEQWGLPLPGTKRALPVEVLYQNSPPVEVPVTTRRRKFPHNHVFGPQLICKHCSISYYEFQEHNTPCTEGS